MRLLRDPRLWAGLALGVALILPNLAWNAAHGFATFAHTADNAKWGGSLLKPGKGLEFLGAQFAVFGPILLTALGDADHKLRGLGVQADDYLSKPFNEPELLLRIRNLLEIRAILQRRYARDLRIVHRQLLGQGPVRWVGEGWPEAAPAPDAALAAALSRIRGLFGL